MAKKKKQTDSSDATETSLNTASTVVNKDKKKDIGEKKSSKAKEKKAVKKSKKRIVTASIHPLEQFGSVRKEFILENIRYIDYRDIAKLIGVKPVELKAAVEEMGIKLPIERAEKWSEIDVGKYRSLANCARCQVQINHSTFFVGIKNCKKCMEKNIKHWIENGICIDLRFYR